MNLGLNISRISHNYGCVVDSNNVMAEKLLLILLLLIILLFIIIITATFITIPNVKVVNTKYIIFQNILLEASSIIHQQ